MDQNSYLLGGILVVLVCILVALIAWLRSWTTFVREYRDGHETMRKLLRGNFSDLIEAVKHTKHGQAANLADRSEGNVG